MNTLNLARINEQSPYEVWQTSEGDFNFQTDFDVFYRISFRIEQTIWDDGAYEFSIINQNQRSSPNDKKVRDRLFLRWFKEYEHSDKFFIKISTITAA